MSTGRLMPVDRPRTEDRVGPAQIGERLGVSAKTVRAWRARYADFPILISPLDERAVWLWADIVAWGRARGRLA